MKSKPICPFKFIELLILLIACFAGFFQNAAAQTNCYPPPSGMVSWWPLNGNWNDVISGNNGIGSGSTNFTSGKVGQGMMFDGSSSYIRVPASPSLNVGAGTGFTIEMWINPANLANEQSLAEWNTGTGTFGNHLTISTPGNGGGPGSIWGTLEDNAGNYYYMLTPPGVLTNGVFQHIAWTWDEPSGLDTLYLNGTKVAQTNFGSFTTRTAWDLYFGVRISGVFTGLPFNGVMDEISLYDRALSQAEISNIVAASSAGKCTGAVGYPPAITQQPTNVAIIVGGTAAFTVGAGGSPTLVYAWKYGSSQATIGTNATLTLTNVQASQTGSYYVQVSNPYGSTNSVNATLTITNPPAILRVVGTNSAPANSVTVPVQLVANGNENDLSFSLSFTPSALNYLGASLGSNASGASFTANLSSLGSGKVGYRIILPADTTFNSGTQDVLHLVFGIPSVTTATSTTISFGDSPIARQIADVMANPLPGYYSNAIVNVTAATALEGDLFPRTNGDKSLTTSDWQLVGQFVVGNLTPTNSSEFQRIDCAPRSTFGDGQLTTCDWVQAGRYAFDLDPATPIGGPVSAVATNISAGPSATRIVSLTNDTILQGQTGTFSVTLASQDNENALGFSLRFDPTQYRFVNASLGSGTESGTFILNTNSLGSGLLGVLVGLPSGGNFPAGMNEVLRVTLQALPGSQNATTSALSFGDQPVFREISDAFGIAQPSSYTNATLTTHPILPTLNIALSGSNITLFWPLWASNFGLSQAGGALPPSSSWSNLSLIPAITASNLSVTITNAGATNYFRLHNP